MFATWARKKENCEPIGDALKSYQSVFKVKGGIVLKYKINWGVIGSGGIAQRRTIPEGIMPAKHAALVAVYDTDVEINNSVAKKFNAKAVFSIQELIDSDIDAIYVASPVGLHLDHAIACAKGKKHVFCEKPLGISVEEAERMIQICNHEGVLLGTAFMMRFLAQHQAGLNIINAGKLGKPVYCRAQLSCWYPPMPGAWRQYPGKGGGGALVDMGSHCIDLLEMFFGEVAKVSCFINNNVHDYQSEDSAIVSLVFKNGAMGTVDSYFCIPDNSSKNILELYGSKGSIIAKGTIGQGTSGEMIAYLEDDNSGYNAQQARNASEGLILNPLPVNTYLAEIEEFSSAILENREPENNFARGLHSQKVLAACYQSARTKKVVEII
ncbi:MAG: Gfo/Idh/MocA family oxidoreductase [Prolixibacteraceae bacterium]|jgi:predicted dehydrogenase|nr:Gfo/Idh/MocA family oxidoreductase [Prolixibacteraceae bacterium]